MKKVLITGANSYIGMSVENWLKQHQEEYMIDTVDMVDGSWKKKDFSSYNAVFHVAGIAHADVGKVSEERKAFYYKINKDLAIETARKAKADGVSQFIFMSSSIIYGESAPIAKKKVITGRTHPCPSNFYGDSKLQAEKIILLLNDEKFKVVILRPPMIYGKDCKGNYTLLSKAAKKLPFFPDIQNERSMLYIDNFCEFVRLMIENEENGIYFPQNEEYVCTSQMVRLIAGANGKKIRLWKLGGAIVALAGKIPGKTGKVINKAFGNLIYDKNLSKYKCNYWINDLESSIMRTEGK